MDPWADDKAFKNLANNRDLLLHKLSWHCASLECEACDGAVHYHIKQFRYREFDAKTGQTKDVYDEFEWNTEFQSVQLEGGVSQNRENTPEGTKCECFCHRQKTEHRRIVDAIPALPSKLKSTGKKLHEMLSAEEKKKLK